jgi:membrane-associated PAP2 superfamily phosphatase
MELTEDSMNRPLALAAFGMVATLALHGFGGEFVVYRPLLADASTPEKDLYVGVLWHGLTAIIGLGAVALIFAARQINPPRALLCVIGGQTLAVGLMFILFGLIRTASLLVAPQWIVLVPLGLLILWTARPTGTNSAG